MDPALSAADRDSLLRLARLAIAQRLGEHGALDRALEAFVPSSALERRCGLFVTLKLPLPGASATPALRGCIGVLEPSAPLYRQVIDTAPKAAFDDPRFPPLDRDELDVVRISLSVLTPPQRIDDAQAIEVGRDGVQLRHGLHHAVFLPHVAAEQGWDRRSLLDHLAVKAGLARDAWRSAELFVFRAESFGEPLSPASEARTPEGTGTEGPRSP